MSAVSPERPATRQRLSKADRRRQLLGVALDIIREEGADGLTLGQLALKGGVSKPIAYDHFGTRSGLLIALYRWIDTERVDAFQRAMAAAEMDREQVITRLAEAYIRCAADLTGEFHIVGAALAGSLEKAQVYEELLAQSVAMFVAVLRPVTNLSDDAATRLCIGLVGAGEALSAGIVRRDIAEADAIATFAGMIANCLS